MLRKVFFIEMTNLEDGNISYYEPFLSEKEFEKEKKVRFDEMNEIDNQIDYGTYQVIFTSNYLLRTSFGYHFKFDPLLVNEQPTIHTEKHVNQALTVVERLLLELSKIDPNSKVKVLNQFNDEVIDFRIQEDRETSTVTVFLEENYQKEND